MVRFPLVLIVLPNVFEGMSLGKVFLRLIVYLPFKTIYLPLSESADASFGYTGTSYRNFQHCF